MEGEEVIDSLRTRHGPGATGRGPRTPMWALDDDGTAVPV